MGSRAMYLYSGGKDTLFRIHGTNQPEYIGASISSGCIRMTNEDVIDLYDRVKLGTVVVVLEPKHGDSPFNSQMALQGGSATRSCNSRLHFGTNQKRRFYRRFFVAGLSARPCSAGGRTWRGIQISAPLGLGSCFKLGLVLGLAATSRGGASSGRPAGISGAIGGSGSQTFHWHIL